MSSKKQIRTIVAVVVFGCAVILAYPLLRPGRNSSPESQQSGLVVGDRANELVIVNAMRDVAGYGFQPGDTITHVDEIEVSSIEEFRDALKQKEVGDDIRMDVRRNDADIAINRTYEQPIEVHRVQGGQFQDQPLGKPEVTLGGTKIIQSEWADFGLKLNEQDGQLVIRDVTPGCAADAYGLQTGDILFQFDRERLSSLNDFHRLAAEKFVGDDVDLMLFRDEDVLLIREMQLGATNQTVAAPDGYALTTIHLADLNRKELQSLLESPFEFRPTAAANSSADPQMAAVERMPAVDETLSATPGLPQLANQAENAQAVIDAAPSDDDHDQGESPDGLSPQDFLAITPVAPAVTVELESPEGHRKPSIRRITPEEDFEVVNRGDDVLSISKPNAIPRFNKYSSIRLPDVETLTQRSRLEEGLASVESPKVAAPDEVTGELSIPPTPTQSRARKLPSTKEIAVSAKAKPGITGTGSKNKIAGNRPSDAFGDAAGKKVFEAGPRPPLHRAPANAPGDQNRSLTTSARTAAVGTAKSSGLGLDNEATSLAVVASPANQSGVSADWIKQPKIGCYLCCDEGCPQCPSDCLSNELSLNRLLHGDCQPLISIGGWLSAGYHTAGNDLFNDRPDRFSVHQAWIYAEKIATRSSRFGFRADLMYGIDAADTQAFGNPAGQWDFQNGFDRGANGWAIPQLYAEAMLGDWRVKVGHFFTPLGFETITAPDNFFYSHAITMYNSEPFTHTGVLASRRLSERVELFAGWTLGWDTGFDQFDGGSSWLGGMRFDLSDQISLNSFSTAGNLGRRGDNGFAQSVVLNLTLTEQLTWIVQSDYLRVESTGEDNLGLNQYFLFSLSEKLAVGARFEWWKGDVLTGYAPHAAILPAQGSLSYYAATLGLNYRPYHQVMLRPEVRFDWSPAGNYDEAYFGMDAILTF